MMNNNIKTLAKEFTDIHFYPDIVAKGPTEESDDFQDFVERMLQAWVEENKIIII